MEWKEYEVKAMKRARALAGKGRGAVEPNPMVGACVVRAGKIIAEGYHRRFGGPHAEVEALRKAGEGARGAEVFVTLEPCCHFGKTPPCADALIEAGVRRVVAAMEDPFAKVRGGGFARLRGAGVEVAAGLLETEARELNAPYVKLRTMGLPYVIAKWAMTLDGNIAAAGGDSKWISSEASRRLAHRLRGRVDAVVVGAGTVARDDPLLTARPKGRRVAARVVLDSKGKTALDCRLVRTAAEAPVIVAVGTGADASRVKALREAGVEVVATGGEGRADIAELMRELGAREMTNVLVEGGAEVLGSFFAGRFVDEVEVFVAAKLAGAGVGVMGGWGIGRMREALELGGVTVRRAGGDMVVRGRVSYPD